MSITIISNTRKVREFLVYDLEWIPGTLQVRCVGVYDGNEYRCYRSVEAFLDGELTYKNRGKWFYAHAGGLADFQFVLHVICKAIDKRGFKIDGSFSGSSVIIAHIKRGKNAWHFIDSYWLLRDKLKNIAKFIGEEKGGGDFSKAGDPDEEGISDEEYERRRAYVKEWYATAPFEELRKYNENDCYILWRAIYEFQVVLLELGGQLQMTIASTGMHLFRRKYLKQEIITSDKINEIARLAYVASRVEVFENEIDNAYYYDINSSFPFAMLQPLPGNYAGASFGKITKPNKPYLADVKISVPDNYITSVPIRMKGRIFFPSGRWRNWLTNIDIELLLQEGGKIEKIYEVLYFDPFTDLGAYCSDIYEKRKKATSEYERIVYKYLMNCVYGKFAESSAKQALIVNPNVNPMLVKQNTNAPPMGMVGPGIFLQEKIVSVPHCHVPISAHITAIGRRNIFNYMSQCEEIHYCDTDGFSTTEQLQTGNELGDIKLEQIIKRGNFVTQKLYHIDGQKKKKNKETGEEEWVDNQLFKAKGFSRIAGSASRFAKILEGESINFERMARIKENLKKGRTLPVEIMVKKGIKVKSIYDEDFDTKKHAIGKRFAYPDGKTRPWHISELKDIFDK